MKAERIPRFIEQWHNLMEARDTHPYALWRMLEPVALHPACGELNNKAWRVDGAELSRVIDEHLNADIDTCRCKLLGVTQSRLGLNGMVVMD